jgi:hypothetical protein
MSESYHEMAVRLGCDAIYLCRDTLIGKSGEVIDSVSACRTYAQANKSKYVGNSPHVDYIRWIILVFYFSISPILFMNFNYISTVEFYLLTFTAIAVCYSLYQVSISRQKLREVIVYPKDPVAGIELLFIDHSAERRWNHKKPSGR